MVAGALQETFGLRVLERLSEHHFAKALIATSLFISKELKKATRGFHKDNKMSSGRFS